MSAIHVAKLALALQESIMNKEFEGKSPVVIITKGMEILEDIPELMGTTKKEILIKAIERIANGKDGISGTEDDLITQEQMNILKIMIDNNIVEGLINVIYDAARGKFNISKAIVLANNAGTTCIPKCIEMIFRSKQK
jgi:hypothetical protein